MRVRVAVFIPASSNRSTQRERKVRAHLVDVRWPTSKFAKSGYISRPERPWGGFAQDGGFDTLQDSLLDTVTGTDPAPDALLTRRSAPARARVTVIDDSPEFLALIDDVLAPAHDVVTQQVVHSVAAIAATTPDLLVVDLHCGGPEGGLTGWEIVAQARRHPRLRYVPIVLCSADLAALREDRISLIGYGDVQLVAKPFDLLAFEQLVGRTLRLADGPRPVPLEDADYPRLEAVPMVFREGRPLQVCSHGRVRDQGEYCALCG